MMKKLMLLGICFVLMLGASSFAVVIGDWEGSSDGWVDWSTPNEATPESWDKLPIDDPTLMPSIYDYDTIGATLGSQSIKLTQTGYRESLMKAVSIPDFLANDILSFDLTIAADWLLNGTGGWSQIEQIVINSDVGYAEQLSASTGNQYWWNGSPVQTTTVTLDYSAHKAAMIANGAINYLEIILVTNGQRDDGSEIDFYFDNAQLTVPEPTTMCLLGLGAVLLRRKK